MQYIIINWTENRNFPTVKDIKNNSDDVVNPIQVDCL